MKVSEGLSWTGTLRVPLLLSSGECQCDSRSCEMTVKELSVQTVKQDVSVVSVGRRGGGGRAF